MSTPEDNKRIVRRFVQVFESGDTSVLSDVIAQGAIDHNTPSGSQPAGPEALAAIVRAFRTGFPDLRIEIEREVAEQDYVVQYGFLVGTNAGELFGRPATDKPARFAYMDMHRIYDGKIVESWHIEDFAGMTQQLS
jgi:predicted ester cyclase